MNKITALISSVFVFSGVIANQSLPAPGAGLKIIPLNHMNLPSGFKEDFQKRKEEENKNGFYYTYSDTAIFLLNLPATAATELKKIKYNTNPNDTHLKASSRSIPTTFEVNEKLLSKLHSAVLYTKTKRKQENGLA